jgi:hypothetical protein
MKNEMLDGFDIDADEEEQGGGKRKVIQGARLRFSNDFVWTDDNEEEIPNDLELVVIDRQRVLQKWGPDNVPVETRWLAPKEKWPDVEKLNAEVPKKEWRDGISGLTGPWQCQWIIYLLNLLTLDKYTYPTSTTGGHIAIGDLSDRIKTMRRLRGRHVFPIVRLSDAFMNTKFGGRQRPSFKIMRWIEMGPDGATLPAGDKPQALTHEAQPAERVVEEPTTKEVLDHSVDF